MCLFVENVMLLKIHNSKGRKHCNYGRIIEQNDGKHDKYMPHPYKDRRDRRKAKKQAFLLYKEGGGDSKINDKEKINRNVSH